MSKADYWLIVVIRGYNGACVVLRIIKRNGFCDNFCRKVSLGVVNVSELADILQCINSTSFTLRTDVLTC